VQASDGHVLGTWSGAQSAYDVLVARGRVFVTGQTSPGKLYWLDPGAAPTAVSPLSAALGGFPRGITTDGSFIWTANSNSVSRVDPDTGDTTPFTGFGRLNGIIFDGTNLWVTDETEGTLKKLDSGGAILQSVPVGAQPQFPVFDGFNIWVPNLMDSTLTVVRVRDGQVLATLTGNGLNAPVQAAFDGQRILVTNKLGSSVSLWKAADLSPIGSFQTGPGTIPLGACSDGINFWITLGGSIARF
jgi:DNA-binding beta-propeller fold protein YncE